MTTPTAASLLHLVDRAERGSLLAEEAQQLRNGIRALGVRDQEMEQLRADLAGVQLRACRTAEALRVAEDQRDRIRTQLLKVLTRAEQAEAERDRRAEALKRVRDRRDNTRALELLGVRRFGEDETTPVLIDGRKPCGLFSDHIRLSCLGLSYTDRAGQYGLIHLTTADALRLSDLLRALSDATLDQPQQPTT